MSYDAMKSSARKFIKRFGASPTVGDALRVFLEEVGEVTHDANVFKIWREYAGDDENAKMLTSLAEEIADVETTLINLRDACGVTDEMMDAARQKVANKNDAKTAKTHYLNTDTGKITRFGR